MLLHLFEPEKAVHFLMTDTLNLVRQANESKTMSELLFCHDILCLTDQINQPWEKHPGEMYGDSAAFQDLYCRAGYLLIYNDPSRDRMIKYVGEIKRLIHFWKMLKARN